MYEIMIDEAMRKKAKEYERRVLSRVRGENYTGFSKPGRYYVGHLAELVFAKLLDGYDLPYIHLTNDEGYSDGGADFIACIRIDVKHVPEYGDSLIVGELQRLRGYDGYERRVEFDIYLPIWINGRHTIGKVDRYCEREKIDTAPIRDYGHGPTRSIKLIDLPKVDISMFNAEERQW